MEGCFVPTPVTDEMREMPSVKGLYLYISTGVLGGWSPGFVDGKVASRFVDIQTQKADTLVGDRNWERLITSHFLRFREMMKRRHNQAYQNVESRAANARQLALDNPNTFDRPSANELRKLKRGDRVKICITSQGVPGERFWVLVHCVEPRRGGRVRGDVANDLVFVDLKLGERVEFAQDNIFDIAPRNPKSLVLVASRVAPNTWEDGRSC